MAKMLAGSYWYKKRPREPFGTFFDICPGAGQITDVFFYGIWLELGREDAFFNCEHDLPRNENALVRLSEKCAFEKLKRSWVFRF